MRTSKNLEVFDFFADTQRGCSHISQMNEIGKEQGSQVFVVQSSSDPFEDRPELVPLREKMFEAVDKCQFVRLVLVTKSPQNVRNMWGNGFGVQNPASAFRKNVCLLTSVSDQATAEAMIPQLLRCRDLCPVLGIWICPLIRPINVRNSLGKRCEGEDCRGETSYFRGLDWVIVGGESGQCARPCNLSWIRSIIWNCKATEVPCFVKQLGSQPIEPVGVGYLWKLMLNDENGGDPSEWPSDIRVREFPESHNSIEQKGGA